MEEYLNLKEKYQKTILQNYRKVLAQYSEIIKTPIPNTNPSEYYIISVIHLENFTNEEKTKMILSEYLKIKSYFSFVLGENLDIDEFQIYKKEINTIKEMINKEEAKISINQNKLMKRIVFLELLLGLEIEFPSKIVGENVEKEIEEYVNLILRKKNNHYYPYYNWEENHWEK